MQSKIIIAALMAALGAGVGAGVTYVVVKPQPTVEPAAKTTCPDPSEFHQELERTKGKEY